MVFFICSGLPHWFSRQGRPEPADFSPGGPFFFDTPPNSSIDLGFTKKGSVLSDSRNWMVPSMPPPPKNGVDRPYRTGGCRPPTGISRTPSSARSSLENSGRSSSVIRLRGLLFYDLAFPPPLLRKGVTPPDFMTDSLSDSLFSNIGVVGGLG